MIVHRRQLKRIRSDRGQQITEFAAALVLLVLLFFIPLLDLGIMPIRYFMSQELIGQYVRRLSHCETLTQAYAELNADPALNTRLIKLGGVKPTSIRMFLAISRVQPPLDRIEVEKPRTIPKDWLPDGKRQPCEYILELVCQCEISPAIQLNMDPKVIGLSSPVPFELSASSPWENLGRNPVTKQFYINE